MYICEICRYKNEECDGDHCGHCGRYEYDKFMPDWVSLISIHFGVSINHAKKMYHNLLAEYYIYLMSNNGRLKNAAGQGNEEII